MSKRLIRVTINSNSAEGKINTLKYMLDDNWKKTKLKDGWVTYSHIVMKILKKAKEIAE